jgi:hypothetical protein
VIRKEDKTPLYFVRRGTLYGAALGMLAGLAAVTMQGTIGREAIVDWRNWIIGGALLGLVAGVLKAVHMIWKPKSDQDYSRPSKDRFARSLRSL